MSKINGVVFGGSGRFGRNFLKIYPEYLAPERGQVDITDYKNLESYLKTNKPEYVIHAAAVVGWREAEADYRRTYETNIIGTENVVRACAKLGLRLIFLSSVAVFDGQRGSYKENDLPHPAYYYGWTKLIGEQMVKLLSNYVVIRTDFYVPGSFKYPEVFSDHFCSKIPVDELATAVHRIARSGYKGTLHVGRARETLFNILKKTDKNITGIKIKDSNLPDFPPDLSLNITNYLNLSAIGAM